MRMADRQHHHYTPNQDSFLSRGSRYRRGTRARYDRVDWLIRIRAISPRRRSSPHRASHRRSSTLCSFSRTLDVYVHIASTKARRPLRRWVHAHLPHRGVRSFDRSMLCSTSGRLAVPPYLPYLHRRYPTWLKVVLCRPNSCIWRYRPVRSVMGLGEA